MRTKIFLNNICTSILCLSFVSVVTAQSGLDDTINALAVIPEATPLIYAGTDKGLHVSTNNGRAWRSLGLTDHPVKDIHILPSDKNVIHVAAGSKGILKSTNGGKDWAALKITLSTDIPIRNDSDIRSLAFDNASPSTLYVGTFEGYILKTADEGKTWSVLNPDFPLMALNALAIHPSSKGTIYAGLGGRGVVKSTDGGATWADMNNGLLDKTVTRLIVNPVQPEILYAGTYGGGVFVSEDSGQTWTPANSGLTNTFVYALSVSPGAVNSDGDEDIFSIIKQTIANIAGNSSPGLIVGVYGGNLYKSSGSGKLHWQPLTAE